MLPKFVNVFDSIPSCLSFRSSLYALYKTHGFLPPQSCSMILSHVMLTAAMVIHIDHFLVIDVVASANMNEIYAM